MKKNTKKKIFTLMLVIMLLSIAIVGGSLAWFTAEDQATNTFTVGTVDIELIEDFNEPDKMLPIVNTENPESDINFIDKDARIYNSGKNAAYVQILVAVPSELNAVGAIHWKDVSLNDWTERFMVDSVQIDGSNYDVYRYRYNQSLAPGDTTSDVISGVYLDAALDYNNDKNCFVMNGTDIDGYSLERKIHVYVVAQAVQAKGFTNANSALQEAFKDTLPTFVTTTP